MLFTGWAFVLFMFHEQKKYKCLGKESCKESVGEIWVQDF